MVLIFTQDFHMWFLSPLGYPLSQWRSKCWHLWCCGYPGGVSWVHFPSQFIQWSKDYVLLYLLLLYFIYRYWIQNSLSNWHVGPMFFSSALSWLAILISKKSLWNIFLGERLRSLAVTLRGVAPLVTDVTTLGGCGHFLLSMTLVGDDGLLQVWNMVWCSCLTGDVSTG